MDKGIEQAVVSVDWAPILWAGGIIASIIGGLLLWIGSLLKSDRNAIVARQDKHETWIFKQQDEIHDLSEYTKVNIEVVRNILEDKRRKK
jgi:hypothetical protein